VAVAVAVAVHRVASLVEVWCNTTLAASTAAAVSSLSQGMVGPCPEVRLRLCPTNDPEAGGAPLLSTVDREGGEAGSSIHQGDQGAWLEMTGVAR
jgi:hypothetical protein